MKDLNQFIDKLIEEKGFDEKDPEVLEQIKTDLISHLEDRIDAMVLNNIKEEDLPAFEKALDSNNKEEIEKFTLEHIPDINEKVANEMLNFRNIYLG
ncbi:MAG: DUF5663 domain-containing protein [Patescibacteria group bacterium]